MTPIRFIKRYVPRWGWRMEPRAQLVRVTLYRDLSGYSIVTPWSCVEAWNGEVTTDEQLASLLRPCFESETEALDYARGQVPFFYAAHNQAINGRLDDAIRWHGDLVGPGRLRDVLGVSEERLFALARGAVKATRAQAKLALAWKGGAA